MVPGLSVAKFGNTRRMERHRIPVHPVLSCLTYRVSSGEVVHASDNPQIAQLQT